MDDWQEAFADPDDWERVFDEVPEEEGRRETDPPYLRLAQEEWQKYEERVKAGENPSLTYIALGSYMDAQRLGFESHYIRWKRVIQNAGGK